MAQIPKGRLGKGPYKPICNVGTVLSTFSTTVKGLEGFEVGWRNPKMLGGMKFFQGLRVWGKGG